MKRTNKWAAVAVWSSFPNESIQLQHSSKGNGYLYKVCRVHGAVTLSDACGRQHGTHLTYVLMIDSSSEQNLQNEHLSFSSHSLSHSWYFPSVLLVSGDKAVIVHQGNHRTHMLLRTESEWSHIGLGWFSGEEQDSRADWSHPEIQTPGLDRLNRTQQDT